MSDLVAVLRANAKEPHMTIGGRPFAIEAANEIERLRDELAAAKHTAISYANREIEDMNAMRTVRSLLRGLPASKTAVQIDEILANVLAAAGGDVPILTL